MAVLELKPTRAPDLTGTSEILARAGLSMSQGFEAAQGLLGSYQAGQTERADNEVFAEIAKLKSQEQIDAYFDGDGIAGRPISVAARERLGSLRSNRANLNQVQAQTASTLASTVRQDQVRAQAAAEETFRLGKRDRDIATGSDTAAALREAYNGVPAATTLNNAVGGGSVAPTAAPGPAGDTQRGFMSTVAAGYTGADGVRVEGISNPYSLAAIEATGQHESAFDPKNVNREWADGENNAGGVMSWNGDRLTAMQGFVGDDKSPEAQARFLLQENPELSKALQASGSLEESMALMDNAWAYKGFDQPGGEKGRRFATAQGIYAAGNQPAAQAGPEVDPLANLRNFALGDPLGLSGTRDLQLDYGRGQQVLDPGAVAPLGPDAGTTAVPRDTAFDPIAAAVAPQVTPAPVSLTPAQDRSRANRADNQFMGSAERIARDNALRGATAQGKLDRRTERTRLRTLEVNELVAAAITDAALDPNNITEAAVSNIVASIPRLTAQESIAAREEVRRLVGEDGVLAPVLSPDISGKIDKAVGRVVQTEVEAGEESIKVLPQFRLYELADKFEIDPLEGLWTYLELENDDMKGSTLFFGLVGEDGEDKNLLRKLIYFIADEAVVTPAQAAAGMAEQFDRDPNGRNENATRFQTSKTIQYLKDNMSVDARSRFESQREKVQVRRDELTGAASNLKDLMIRREKMTGKAEIRLADTEIKKLKQILRGGNTPREASLALEEYIGLDGNGGAIAAAIARTELGSAAYKAGVTLLRSQINSDDTLTSGDKLLLITMLKG